MPPGHGDRVRRPWRRTQAAATTGPTAERNRARHWPRPRHAARTRGLVRLRDQRDHTGERRRGGSAGLRRVGISERHAAAPGGRRVLRCRTVDVGRAAAGSGRLAAARGCERSARGRQCRAASAAQPEMGRVCRPWRRPRPPPVGAAVAAPRLSAAVLGIARRHRWAGAALPADGHAPAAAGRKGPEAARWPAACRRPVSRAGAFRSRHAEPWARPQRRGREAGQLSRSGDPEEAIGVDAAARVEGARPPRPDGGRTEARHASDTVRAATWRAQGAGRGRAPGEGAAGGELEEARAGGGGAWLGATG